MSNLNTKNADSNKLKVQLLSCLYYGSNTESESSEEEPNTKKGIYKSECRSRYEINVDKNTNYDNNVNNSVCDTIKVGRRSVLSDNTKLLINDIANKDLESNEDININSHTNNENSNFFFVDYSSDEEKHNTKIIKDDISVNTASINTVPGTSFWTDNFDVDSIEESRIKKIKKIKKRKHSYYDTLEYTTSKISRDVKSITKYSHTATSTVSFNSLVQVPILKYYMLSIILL